ncbi:DUF4468 domain-containing protein [Mucilaginibacter lacusdianchii]|uniref:DUF4468 domain-containing protein n=1 Tax=Mucilaginibacter lacusdianchii TaxID=2684211 RepID=UPI00131DBFEE|nr:DUF4468 domain-containing protein [Mucilaginibacter sp. JXJ CY 39]
MNYTVDFLKRNYPGITLYKDDVKDSTLEGNGKVLLYKKSMLSGQEDGEVTYQLRIDFKNGKYRLLLTNFNYTPYKRTRFGTFAPVAGIVVSLDNPGKSIGAKQADNYLNQIGAYSAAFDKQLEAYLQNPLASKENKPALKKVNTTNW